MMFGSEKLEVWRQAIDFADAVYSVTGGFPADGIPGTKARMRKASVAISANIAEACAMSNRRDSARYLENASAAVQEVLSLSLKARALGYLNAEDYLVLGIAAREQMQVLGGLRRSLPEDT